MCGATTTQSVPSLGGHIWDEGAVTTEPTYTSEGVLTFTCTRCGETYTEAIPAKPQLDGDVNGDGIVNMRDMLAMKKFAAGVYSSSDIVFVNADVDDDGAVNSRDISLLKKLIASVGI